MNRLRIVPIIAVLLSAVLAGSVFAAGAEEGAAGERGPIEMTYLRFGGPDDITQEEALIARWEEANPGDTIVPLIAPFPQFKEKLDTMVAGGQSPDIIFGWPTPFANLWANERIISLNELVQGDVDFNIDDYPQHKQFIFDGELTGIPYNATAHILVYNKTMFDEAGLETPIEMYNRGAWTWSNAIEVAKQLTVDEDGDGTPDQYGMVDMGDNPVPILTAVWAHGGRLFNEDFTEITFDSPETREALQLLVDLVARAWGSSPARNAGGRHRHLLQYRQGGDRTAERRHHHAAPHPLGGTMGVGHRAVPGRSRRIRRVGGRQQSRHLRQRPRRVAGLGLRHLAGG